jgi:predicted CoA-binding protein
MEDIGDILTRYRSITVVGCSRDETKYSYRVAKFMQDAGYTIIPINPFASELLGEKVYRDIASLPQPPEIVDVFRPAAEGLEITIQAVASGARAVWLQEGIVNDDARKYAQKHGVAFVQNRCIMKEYVRLNGEI